MSQHDRIDIEESFVMSELFHSTAWTEDEHENVCENLNADFVIQALPDQSRELMLSKICIQIIQYESLSPHLRRPQRWRVCQIEKFHVA